MHHLDLEGLLRQLLAHGEVVLVDHFNRDVDCLSGLLKLYAHFVDAVDDALAPLRISYRLFRVES